MAEEKKKKKNFIKTFLDEFKTFALKGNVMSMAVGVIIGAAFQNIVTALTNSFINPLIALITGGVEVDENGNPIYIGGSFVINGAEFKYGEFLSAVINFLIMALILFFLIKGMNTLMSAGEKRKKKKEGEPEPEPAKEPEPDPQLVLLAEIRDLLKSGDAADIPAEDDAAPAVDTEAIE